MNLCVCSALREESEVLLQELRVSLDAERAAERDRLEARKRQDLERLKAEWEEELQAERRRLQGEREEKLASLKQEVKPKMTPPNMCLISVAFKDAG